MAKPVDFVQLTNSIANGGQFDPQPSESMRMAQVIGFDPNYEGSGSGGPLLSIQLSGDDSPLHGVAYVSSYTPKLNDTVWVNLSSTDAIVQSAIAGNTPATNGSTITNNGVTTTTTGNGGQGAHSHLLGRKVWQDSHLFTTPISRSDLRLVPTSGTGASMNISCEVLPNQFYKIEISTTILVTGTPSSDGYFSIGVFAPPDTLQTTTVTQNETVYTPVSQISIPTQGYYTVSGSIVWSLSEPTAQAGDWKKMFTNSDFTWYVGLETGYNTPSNTTENVTWNIQFAPTNPFPKTSTSKKTPTTLTVYNEGPAT